MDDDDDDYHYHDYDAKLIELGIFSLGWSARQRPYDTSEASKYGNFYFVMLPKTSRE